MTQTFSVVTTWGDQHWDHHAKRSVQSILAQWPEQVAKFFYPDNLSQQIKAPNTNYYSVATEQPTFNEFKDRASNDIDVKEKMNISKNA